MGIFTYFQILILLIFNKSLYAQNCMNEEYGQQIKADTSVNFIDIKTIQSIHNVDITSNMIRLKIFLNYNVSIENGLQIGFFLFFDLNHLEIIDHFEVRIENCNAWKFVDFNSDPKLRLRLSNLNYKRLIKNGQEMCFQKCTNVSHYLSETCSLFDNRFDRECPINERIRNETKNTVWLTIIFDSSSIDIKTNATTTIQKAITLTTDQKTDSSTTMENFDTTTVGQNIDSSSTSQKMVTFTTIDSSTIIKNVATTKIQFDSSTTTKKEIKETYSHSTTKKLLNVITTRIVFISPTSVNILVVFLSVMFVLSILPLVAMKLVKKPVVRVRHDLSITLSSDPDSTSTEFNDRKLKKSNFAQFKK
jgi:hypothetical protein